MSKTRETWNKKENEKKKQKKREDKAHRTEERKANAKGGGLDNMIAYVDEFGNLSSTPPDPATKSKIKAENIVIGVPKREEGPAVDVIRTGTVTMFSESKGYGFIKDVETQESIFTHVNEHVEPIRENDRVNFRIEYSHKGPNAVEVKLVVK
ncbi:MAG: cold shock domain-containing protein [Chitinophagales bacterium]|nr:cold shock domain-containing protein [Chitinophagales bacterium]